MQIWAETGKSALPIRNYSQILYQFLMFTQNLKRSRRWLRSYGSSITVLEPQKLIDEITESTNKTLSYYEKLKSIMA